MLLLLQQPGNTPSSPDGAASDAPAGAQAAVRLANTDDVAALASELPRLARVDLQFPKWTDGRAYSQARLLRGRHRFAGDLRATGEVLIDMLPLLARSGFTSAVLRADQSLVDAQRALAFFSGHYQPPLSPGAQRLLPAETSA